MTIYDKLNKWAEERLLHQVPFDKTGYTQNIIEELTEMWGVPKEQQRDVAKKLTKLIVEEACNMVSEYGVTDAICDISVFSATAQRQRSIDMNKAMGEVYKEISSRTGSYIDSEKKWIKDTSEKARAKWYKADFSDCNIKEVD